MSLIEEVASIDQLKKAWGYVKRKKDTPGVDEELLSTFGSSLEDNIKSISESLLSGRYRMNKIRATEIPKNKLAGPDDKRTIKIYTVKDKIVQKSTLISIKKYFPGINNSISVGFITDLSGVSTAIERIKKNYKSGYRLLTVADIEDFFDNIDRKKLFSNICNALRPDSSIEWLIEQCLNPEIIKKDLYSGEEIHIADTGSGVAQGSILAPFFTNIYLMDFDKELENRGIIAIRYVDDMAFLSRSDSKAEMTLKSVSELVNGFGLSLHPRGSKKEPITFSLRYYANFLGIRMQVVKKNSWIIRPTDEKIKYNNAVSVNYINNEKRPFYKRLEKLDRRIEGWFNTYRESRCTRHELRIIYRDTKKIIERALNSVLRRNRIISKNLNSKELEFLGIPSMKYIDRLLTK